MYPGIFQYIQGYHQGYHEYIQVHLGISVNSKISRDSNKLLVKSVIGEKILGKSDFSR
jgi:hypothetical protein